MKRQHHRTLMLQEVEQGAVASFSPIKFIAVKVPELRIALSRQ